MIYATACLTHTQADEFEDQLNAAISQYQSSGLRVEVQFSATTDINRARFSALLIAYRQES